MKRVPDTGRITAFLPRVTLEGPSRLGSSGRSAARTAVMLASCFVGLVCFVAWASDFQVNESTVGDQHEGDVATSPDGRSVAVWTSASSPGDDSQGTAVLLRLLHASGSPRSDEQQVNSTTAGDQRRPAVAMADDGSFFVVWQSDASAGTDNDTTSIQGQRYFASGVKNGGEFQVNTTTTGQQTRPRVSMAPDGRAVVLWESPTVPDPLAGIAGRLYAANGTPSATDFAVNSDITGVQARPDVAVAADGSFLTSWQSLGSPATDQSSWSVQARMWNAAGAPLGSQFQLNEVEADPQTDPSVSAAPTSGFVVAWQGYATAEDPVYYGIRARQVSGAGVPSGSEWAVNTTTSGPVRGYSSGGAQLYPSVTHDSDGDFLVVWSSDHSASAPVRGRRYSSGGAPLSALEDSVGLQPASDSVPRVAGFATDRYLVSWDVQTPSVGPDMSGRSLLGTRYPDGLFSDGFENGNTDAW